MKCKSILPKDLFSYRDDSDDAKFKFSISRYCIYKNETYMLEAALAISGSYLSYMFSPLAYIQNNDTIKWQEVIDKLNQCNHSNILNCNLNDIVVNVCGYTTWFKHIDSNYQYTPEIFLNQKPYSKDVYTSQLTSTDHDIFLESNNDAYLTKSQFDTLVQFEKDRPKEDDQKWGSGK